MKILEIACHEVLEKDTVNILTELGHDISSNSFFLIPHEPLTKVRPPTKNKADYTFINQFREANPGFQLPSMVPNSGVCKLTLEMLDRFDLVIIDYYPWVLTINEEVLKKTKARIILRTIAFGSRYQEEFYVYAKKYRPDIKIVRMSERERMCEIYAGEDAIIRQCYDPDEFLPWTGSKQQILTINKMFLKRADSCGFWEYMEVMQPFEKERLLVGFENEDIDFNKNLSYEDLKLALSESMVYFATFSKPAGFVTYATVEAMCSGLPIVSFNERGNWNGLPTYQVEKFIEQGVTGYYSDDITNLQGFLSGLLNDRELCKRIGEAGRKKGLSLFHKDIIKAQWKEVLDDIGRKS